MDKNLAQNYAHSVADGIRESVEAGAPFGYINPNDESTYDRWDDIPEDERENFETASGHEYVRDCLDIRVEASLTGDFRSAIVFLTLGGPNAWIETDTATLHVHWGSDAAVRSIPREFSDGLAEAVEEYWDMNRHG
ncbi:MAG: hypothetical protein ACTH4Y_08100 [Microbacterium gubbeenense]|uniref:hypothetical protein n=1 Tax=Microbacterium gubbeenense TaxID=159896 RepID=UPI003F95C96D